jgi:hypothetical protein
MTKKTYMMSRIIVRILEAPDYTIIRVKRGRSYFFSSSGDKKIIPL